MADINRLHELLDLIEEAKKLADKEDGPCANNLHMAKVEAERALGEAVILKSRREWNERARSA